MTKGLSDQEIAKCILKRAQRQGDRDPMDVLREAIERGDYGLIYKGDRLSNIKKVIGSIGGEASRQRAANRKNRISREREASRQGRLF